MIVSELLGVLRELGIELAIDGERLRCRAPEGALSPELAAEIRTHKPELLALLASAAETATSARRVAIPRVAERGSYPLSFTQQRNLYASSNGPGLPFAFRLKGEVDIPILETALRRVVERHAPLRTVFLLDGEQPQQRVLPEVPIRLGVTDLSSVVEAREQVLGSKLTELASRPFDLRTGPLFRFLLFKLDEREHALFVAISQMVFDGWSLDVFSTELREGYAALASGKAWPFGEPAVEYADYVAWQRERLAELGPAQLAFWRKTLGPELPPASVPTDKPRPAVASYRGTAIPFELPSDLTQALREMARAAGATLQMVLMTALNVFLARLGGGRDVVIASPIDGRRDPSTEALIGAFANLLLFRTDVDPEVSFQTLLAGVRDACLNAYENQELPIEHLNLRVSRGREPGFVPLWQVEFSFQQVGARGTQMGSIVAEPIRVHSGGAANELAFWVEDAGHRVSGTIEFSKDLFERETIEHWRECYICLLRSAAQHPLGPIGDLDITSTEQMRLDAMMQRAVLAPPAGAGAGTESREKTLLRIVDERGQPLPLGAYGRLAVGSTIRGSESAVRLTATGQLVTRPTEEQRTSSGRISVPPASGRVESGRNEQHGPPSHRSRGSWSGGSGSVPKLRTEAVDVVEFRLVEEFSALLGVELVGLHDSFFDLGGHSLIGVRLLERVKSYFNVRLALGALFEAPTPYLLARIVRAEANLVDPETGEVTPGATRKWSSVVPIQPRGSLPPFFAAAGVGGNPMNLRHLAKHLGPDQPFYGLQHRGTDGLLSPHKSVVSMANEYFEHIRELQPHGPYFLGGFSAGGVAAFELARLFRACGEKVGLVVMFDANSTVAKTSHPPELKQEQLERLRRDTLQFVVSAGRRRLSAYWEAVRLYGAAQMAPWFAYRFRNEAVTVSWEKALRSYRPESYDGDVLVLRARNRDGWMFDESNGWAPLVRGRLDIVHVEGGHTSHVDAAHAPSTAARLREALECARNRCSPIPAEPMAKASGI